MCIRPPTWQDLQARLNYTSEPLLLNEGFSQMNTYSQKDFLPIFIKELGMQYETATSKRPQRLGLFKCTSCDGEYKSRILVAKKKTTTLCEVCSAIKNGRDSGTHLLTKHPLYSRWRGMIKRCYLSTSDGFPMYGAKGVTVCDEWRNSFKAFYDWSINNGYSQELEIDKDTLCQKLNIYPESYSPETCLWVTQEHNLNQREGYAKCRILNKK